MRRTLLLILAASVLAVPTAAAKNAPFVGVWKGNVKSPAGTQQQVVLTITSKLKSNNSGTIVYKSPVCSGKLSFLKLSGRVLTLRETILKGSCPKGGSITLTQWDFRTLYLEWWGTGATSASLSGYVTLGGR